VQLGLVQPTNDEFRAFVADPKTALAPHVGEGGGATHRHRRDDDADADDPAPSSASSCCAIA
jgi:hypothetical protein